MLAAPKSRRHNLRVHIRLPKIDALTFFSTSPRACNIVIAFLMSRFWCRASLPQWKGTLDVASRVPRKSSRDEGKSCRCRPFELSNFCCLRRMGMHVVLVIPRHFMKAIWLQTIGLAKHGFRNPERNKRKTKIESLAWEETSGTNSLWGMK